MQSSVNSFGKPRWQEYLDLPENDLAQHCQVSEVKSLSRLVIDGVEHQPYAFMFSINSAICEALLHPLTSISLLVSHRDAPWFTVLVLGGLHAGH